ncbi:MAG: competence/damage-inducible protein A [Planctomycetes bacterium]|jgi:nicotinamide-nucleotide amidase|nr:competence/damage-inducible protein A [Planctomycetota bacterium]
MTHRAIVLAVGSELATGLTVDSNSAYLARRLGEHGIQTVRHVTVGDDQAAIACAIRDAAADAQWVLVSGGLGPTPDDLTRHALAEAMDAELQMDDASLQHIEAFFRKLDRTMVEGNRIQAMIPAGAEAIANTCGTAPGIAATLGEARVVVLPGVPSEMKAMFERDVVPQLPSGAGAILQQTIRCFGTGESDLADMIRDLMQRGGDLEVGTTVAAGLISVRITSRGPSVQAADDAAQRVTAEIVQRLGSLVIGIGEQQTMERVVGERLDALGQTLATAESCTGGLVGEMLTAVPHSSSYYLGGAVTYCNEAKADILGVSRNILAEYGAVSEPVAGAMAEGARQRFGSDWAIGITGIAGPTGGTDEKPVGLVFIGLTGPDGTDVQTHIFGGSRAMVRRRSALMALNRLRLKLLAWQPCI